MVESCRPSEKEVVAKVDFKENRNVREFLKNIFIFSSRTCFTSKAKANVRGIGWSGKRLATSVHLTSTMSWLDRIGLYQRLRRNKKFVGTIRSWNGFIYGRSQPFPCFAKVH